MDMRKQAEKAEKFRKLHHGPRMLLLPNAWDVASARILEECGHPAIATSSAAVAYSLGYADGQRISRGEMLEVAGRIGRATNIPVTADLEAGYGATAKDMADTVKSAIAEGIIGMNLEDVTGDDESSLVDLPLQVEKIRAIREAAAATGVPFVLNARTDIYDRETGEGGRSSTQYFGESRLPGHRANGKSGRGPRERRLRHHARRHGTGAAHRQRNAGVTFLRDDVRWSDPVHRFEAHDDSPCQ